MKIGLLETGHDRDALEAECGTCPQMVGALLSPPNPQLAFRTYPLLDGGFPGTPDEYDAWLVRARAAPPSAPSRSWPVANAR